jgi:3-deoxy-D-manno-octulosonate 8-phosphate phosphatase (KDO 8-P phosphatase)
MSKPDFSKIKLLILDVDGIMTDGNFYVSDSGDISRKFNVLDGFGIVNAIKRGLEIAVITGGKGKAVTHRCDYLGIKNAFLGREDKHNVYTKILKPKLGIKDEEVAFMGDDVYDIELMKMVGLPITVPDAHEKVKTVAKYITTRKGGEGAVREVIDLILPL